MTTEAEIEMYEIEMYRCVRAIRTGGLNREKCGKELVCSAVSLRWVMAAGYLISLHLPWRKRGTVRQD